jgi:LPS export ABC transporter protein LptC
MGSWQRRARVGLAIFAVAVAVVVYFSIGERRSQPPPAPVERQDPKAVAESVGGDLQRLRQSEQDFSLNFARSLSYEDGSQKMFDVKITVRKSDGRTYVVTADEATAGKDQRERQLTGHVVLKVSDGFEMTTDRATHNQDDSIVRAPGAVAFSKGRMTGSGGNATYDQTRDILTINEQAKVNMTDEKGQPTTDFNAGVAVLDRLQNTLTLDGQAHVLRNQQVIDADHVLTRLSDDEQIVQFIELRNNARVTGGASIDSMSARDIDMDYTDDGQALERVALSGGAGVAMKGTSGGAGRQILGEALDVRLAPDGAIVALTGREKVRLDLPASGDSPAGSITADTLDGTGEAGRGLTSTDFRGKVEYREAGKRGAMDRVVRAESLSAALADDAISDATFKGRVTFEEQGLRARAAEISYQPKANTIALRGSDAGGPPHVSVDQITIDARTIDVGLQDRRITATEVKTTLAPQKNEAQGREKTTGGVAIPGLLKQDQAANINADALDYRGEAGQAVYRGGATMWQGNTTIRGDSISLDQEKGSLVATGSARSTLELDTGVSNGSGNEIRYDDQKRLVTYSGAALPPTTERGTGSAGARSGAVDARRAVPVRDAQLGGPQGDLRAERIEIALAKEGNSVERLEGYTRVTLKLDTRTAVGARLTYYASDERYVMSAVGTTPVTVTETKTAPSGAVSCTETVGRTLTFYKSADTIKVDGNDQNRTETQMKPCAPPSR